MRQLKFFFNLVEELGQKSCLQIFIYWNIKIKQKLKKKCLYLESICLLAIFIYSFKPQTLWISILT